MLFAYKIKLKFQVLLSRMLALLKKILKSLFLILINFCYLVIQKMKSIYYLLLKMIIILKKL